MVASGLHRKYVLIVFDVCVKTPRFLSEVLKGYFHNIVFYHYYPAIYIIFIIPYFVFIMYIIIYIIQQ